MCGIVGYTGEQRAAEILVSGLKRLEYRGYDSAGVALETADDQGTCALDIVKRVGKVAGLESELAGKDSDATCGIGHTRWATHGRPTRENAHPHVSCSGRVAVVHNGIIENYADLRSRLIQSGHVFVSETDTEVLAHLIEEALDTSAEAGTTCDLMEALRIACGQIAGAYGIAVVSADEPGVIAVARKDSPIVIGRGTQGSYVASDVIALIDATRDVVVLEDGQFARLTPTEITYTNAAGEALEPVVTHIDWDIDLAEKGGYPDFMMKEIYEQPRVVRDTLVGRLSGAGEIDIDELGLSFEELNLVDRVYIIACGTSLHAGLIAKNNIESWARIPCEVEAASEFRYRDAIITPSTLVVAVSQSGETADTLAAIRDARIKGAKVFGITNVVGSPVARESDGVIYTKANKEIAVASTKSFIGQVVSLTLLAMLLGQVKGRLTPGQTRMLFRDLGDTAGYIQKVLDTQSAAIAEAAAACAHASSALFVGRGMGAAVSFEGALKLKEVSYLHAEAYAAGEMKHGPIALIEPGFPVIAVATKSAVYDKLVSNLKECEARGAKIIAVATEGDEEIGRIADHVIFVPKTCEAFMPIVATVPLQLLAREVALMRGCDVDQPRNLAKSVTVE
ncbi:glutamine--fructose-6-phosphate transaminase (isomerizing) [Collinsella sp. AGMB00827]|uniref:Glutamine--fructose-6-phosphate aminotransferase [isomerizing] n=1 Tax=Collinsella ureilytica TaxID=2869515 RepID=A0ABS7MK16_9ACTN|nr:glutamine--fructose-6-phosphate transaminase (isomerizing) [Collinsella urealyticum]MBY4797653.1 glutamine--fructose-6-phosphate transaminase (isomerizing) [Collinsella urealyticum]